MTASAAFDDRAAEIIAAYGGDPARWPDAERAAALAAVAADPALAGVFAAARALDDDLTGWARRPVRGGDAVSAAAVAMRRPPTVLRWAAGGGIAASLAVAVVLFTPAQTPIPVAALDAIPDETAFAQVFTPTPDEESVL